MTYNHYFQERISIYKKMLRMLKNTYDEYDIFYIDSNGQRRSNLKVYGFCMAYFYAIAECKINILFGENFHLENLIELKQPLFYKYIRSIFSTYWYPTNKRGIKKRIKILERIINTMVNELALQGYKEELPHGETL